MVYGEKGMTERMQAKWSMGATEIKFMSTTAEFWDSKNVCVIQLLVSLNTIYTWYIAAQVQHIKQHVKVVRFSPFRCLYEPYFSLPLTTHVGYNASLLSSSLLPLLELSLPTAVNQVHTRPHPSSCPRQKEHLRYFPKECVFPFNHKKTLENTFVIMINKSDLLLLSCCSTIM